MPPTSPGRRSPPTSAARFATTRWSLVLAAGRRTSPQSGDALAALCAAYWYPLYAYIRRSGHTADLAQDLTQAFFTRLLEKNYLRAADRNRGKFRSFLLASLKHFLANERDRAAALKRGGGRPLISIDLPAAERRYAHEPTHDLTPEKIFERRWALELLDQVLARLREESIRTAKANVFDRLKVFLAGEKTDASYAQLATELSMTEAAVKVAVHRLRRRYRALLRDEIAHTVATPDQIEDEIRQLFAAVAS